MRIYLSLLIILFSLLSCSKDVKTNKRLSGTWNPVTLKVTNKSTNLSYYAEVSGTLQFLETSKKSTKGSYEFLIDYTLDGNDFEFTESGNYELKEGACILTSSENSVSPGRVVYINKEDLEFLIEIPYTKNLFFILKKQD